MLRRFGVRLRRWGKLLAVAFTQSVFNTFGAGLFWVLTGSGEEPDPDEPFSSRTGRNAIEGDRWALAMEAIINALFFWDPDHCRQSARNFLNERGK